MIPMDKPPLLPCPFCGSRAGWRPLYGGWGMGWQIGCMATIAVPCPVKPTTSVCSSLDRAAEEWNTRKKEQDDEQETQED